MGHMKDQSITLRNIHDDYERIREEARRLKAMLPPECTDCYDSGYITTDDIVDGEHVERRFLCECSSGDRNRNHYYDGFDGYDKSDEYRDNEL